jgi:hypothetical protein
MRRVLRRQPSIFKSAIIPESPRERIGSIDYLVENSYFDREDEKYVYAFPNVGMHTIHVVELIFEVSKVKLWRSFMPKEFASMIGKRFRTLEDNERAHIALCFAGSTEE